MTNDRINNKKVFWGVLFLILYGLMEATSFLALFFLQAQKKIYVYAPQPVSISKEERHLLEDFVKGKTTYHTYSVSLGWTIKPHGYSPLYRANSQGIRGDHEYALTAPTHIIRIGAFGDSFTHCDDVSNSDTWQEKLTRSTSGIEVMNFGVGGFGTDQAFLRYQQDGTPFHPHLVFIGYMQENIARNVNVFRPFYTQAQGHPLAKPRFILQSNEIELIKNPMDSLEQYQDLLENPEQALRQLGTYDYFYRFLHNQGFYDEFPSTQLVKTLYYHLKGDSFHLLKNNVYNPESEAFQVTTKIFSKFYDEVLRNHSIPIILIFPHISDLIRYSNNDTKIYKPLLTYFQENGLRYIELLDGFIQYGREHELDELFRGHYTPLANTIVARYLEEYLKKEGFLDPEKVQKRLKDHPL